MSRDRQTLAEILRMNLGAVTARASVRIVAAFRERSWLIGETVFPILAMATFVLVYRGLGAPRPFEGFAVLGGAMIAYWNNVLWSMASQFFWEKEQGQLQLYLITPVSRMSILLGMALGGMLATTTRALVILLAGILLFHVPFPWERAPGAFGLFVLTLGSLYGLGMILSSVFLMWGRAAWNTATLFQEPIYLLSGFYFPVRALGTVAASFAGFIPITLGLDGIRQILYGEAAHGFLPVAWIVPIQAALLVLYLFLAHRSLLFMENLGKREGRLTIRGG
ncbi:MAG TPA: ABC transporter permease [Candidatus Eisenbacteria bacterium]|nr:ABC transporter permease [Candidatus Eisenbacteria bacterium]